MAPRYAGAGGSTPNPFHSHTRCVPRTCDAVGVPGANQTCGRLPYRGRVRLSHFRELLANEFGSVRASSLATDHVFADLDGQTVNQALEAGWEPREIWKVVCVAYEVPPERR